MPPKYLEWNKEHLGNGRATRVLDSRTVWKERIYDSHDPIVPTRESITCASGAMTWRVSCETSSTQQQGGVAYLGVVAADFKGRFDFNSIQSEPGVWMLSGDSYGWLGDASKFSNVNNEAITRGNKFTFGPGSIVEMTFDPHTQLLTAKVNDREVWSTTRKILGPGVEEVHPCVCLKYQYQRAVVVGRVGQSKQEYDQHTRRVTETIADEATQRGLIQQAVAQQYEDLHDKHTNRRAMIAMGNRVDRFLDVMSGVMQELVTMRMAQQQLDDGMTRVRTEQDLIKKAIQSEHSAASRDQSGGGKSEPKNQVKGVVDVVADDFPTAVENLNFDLDSIIRGLIDG